MKKYFCDICEKPAMDIAVVYTETPLATGEVINTTVNFRFKDSLISADLCRSCRDDLLRSLVDNTYHEEE